MGEPTSAPAPFEVEAVDNTSVPCTDGTEGCYDADHPICCFQGSVVVGCCDVAHPICRDGKCYGQFENDVMAPLEPSVPAQLKIEAVDNTSAPCTDGTEGCY